MSLKRLFPEILIFSFFILLTNIVGAQDIPQEITNSNIKANTVTISWLTDEAKTGYVNYGSTPSLGNTAYDVRGESYEARIHYVEIENLGSSNTLYYYDIISDGVTYDNDGAHYTVTTGDDIPPGAGTELIYGKVFLSDGSTPAEGAIAYIKLKDNDGLETAGQSQICAFLVDAQGVWYYNIKSVRTPLLDDYFQYSSEGDNVVLDIRGPNGEVSSLEVAIPLPDEPVPAITLIPNIAPVLEWTGEPGYENKGLNPEMGYGETPFVFRIKYTDANGDAPTIRNLYLDKNGDNDYLDQGEVLQMQATGSDYANGVIYTYTTKIPYSANSQSRSYYFKFSDGEEFASGTITQAISQETAVNKPDISQTLSVDITDGTPWQLSQITAGSVDNIGKIGVKNSGDGMQTYSLKIIDEGEWTASSNKDGVGVNTFVLSAVFTDEEMVNVDSTYFNEIGNDDVIFIGVADKASSARFGSSKASGTGALVPAGQPRNLWLEFKAPQKDTKGGIQSIKATVNAEIP